MKKDYSKFISQFSSSEAVKFTEELKNCTKGISQFSEIFKEEMNFFYSIFFENNLDSQMMRRMFIRNFYCSVEASINFMKNLILVFSKLKPGEISRAEYAMLNEESYSLTKSGRAVIRPRFEDFIKRAKFIFNIFTRVLVSKDFELNTSGDGWQKFSEGLKIRNRLTHPKYIVDLEVSNEDFRNISIGVTWYIEEFKSLWRIMDKKMSQTAIEVETSIKSPQEALLIYLKHFA